jgi:hypothetical protein
MKDTLKTAIDFILSSKRRKPGGTIMTESDNNMGRGQARDFPEELPILGEQLLSKVKELVHEGNVRRIIIKQEGRTIIEIPLTVGVVGAILAPTLAAIGAVGALLAQCSIEVIRTETSTPSEEIYHSVEETGEHM